MEDHLTPKELARVLGKSEQTIWVWRSKNVGPPYVRNGERGRVYYPKDQLAAWLMDQEF